MALSFANQDASTSAQDAEQLAWMPLKIEYVRQGGDSKAELARLHDARRTVRQSLRHIAERRALPPRLAGRIRRSVQSATARLDFTPSQGLAHVYGTPDVETGAALGVAVLTGSDLAVRLRQCKGRSCEAFFLAEGRRSAAKYCSRECSLKAERDKAAARQRKLADKKRQLKQEK